MQNTKKYYVIKDSTMELVREWLIQNYKYGVTPELVGLVSAEAEDSAMNVGADLASVELASRETISGYPIVFTFNQDDFILSENFMKHTIKVKCVQTWEYTYTVDADNYLEARELARELFNSGEQAEDSAMVGETIIGFIKCNGNII